MERAYHCRNSMDRPLGSFISALFEFPNVTGPLLRLRAQRMDAFLPVELRLPCTDSGSYPAFRATSTAKADQLLPVGAAVDFVSQFNLGSVGDDATII